MNTVLVIDDEPGIRSVLSDILEDEKYKVFLAADGFEALAILREERIDIAVLDIWLPNMGGIDVLKKIKEEYAETEVVVISGHANIDLAVKAVKLGAFDFLEKPLSLEKITTVIRNAFEIINLKRENRNLKQTLYYEDEIIGNCPQMEAVKGLIEQSASSDAKVLILGENGTGKELVAREIHRKSARRGGPFIQVNCAAIPDTLIESELFGHEKGSFTGAVARRKGKFESAHRGTLFLDEIADMSLSAQAKVLRAIQEMRFERVGGEQSISVDVRVIAATNKNLQEEIAAGAFREDLFFRLNVIPIYVPPLRNRGDDIRLLVDYFMNTFRNRDLEIVKQISEQGMKLLLTYDWPGNIRELKNFIERINIMTNEELITEEIVRFYLGEKKVKSKPTGFSEYEGLKLNEARDKFEKMFIQEKLKENNYHISQTAGQLGIYPSNLHGKIKKLGIDIKK